MADAIHPYIRHVDWCHPSQLGLDAGTFLPSYFNQSLIPAFGSLVSGVPSKPFLQDIKSKMYLNLNLNPRPQFLQHLKKGLLEVI